MVVTLLPSSGYANDTLAELPAGRIEFSKTDDIEPLSEDLYLSTKQIRVEYRFFNRSNHDVTSIVAFPMPDRPAFWDSPIDLSEPTPDNFMNFATLVDDHPIKAQVEIGAVLRGRDITERLSKLNISITNPQDDLNKLSDRDCEQLVREQILYRDDCSSRFGRHAAWDVKTNYFWTQTFPAGKEVAIKHSYRPVVGGSIVSDLPPGLGWPDVTGLSCVDEAFRSAVKRKTKGEYEAGYSAAWYTYILTTAKNWASPIKQFRVIVDKESPDNLVSFCGDDVRKISPTQCEMRKTDFVPREDLHVVLVGRFLR